MLELTPSLLSAGTTVLGLWASPRVRHVGDLVCERAGIVADVRRVDGLVASCGCLGSCDLCEQRGALTAAGRSLRVRLDRGRTSPVLNCTLNSVSGARLAGRSGGIFIAPGFPGLVVQSRQTHALHVFLRSALRRALGDVLGHERSALRRTLRSRRPRLHDLRRAFLDLVRQERLQLRGALVDTRCVAASLQVLRHAVECLGLQNRILEIQGVEHLGGFRHTALLEVGQLVDNELAACGIVVRCPLLDTLRRNVHRRRVIEQLELIRCQPVVVVVRLRLLDALRVGRVTELTGFVSHRVEHGFALRHAEVDHALGAEILVGLAGSVDRLAGAVHHLAGAFAHRAGSSAADVSHVACLATQRVHGRPDDVAGSVHHLASHTARDVGDLASLPFHSLTSSVHTIERTVGHRVDASHRRCAGGAAGEGVEVLGEVAGGIPVRVVQAVAILLHHLLAQLSAAFHGQVPSEARAGVRSERAEAALQRSTTHSAASQRRQYRLQRAGAEAVGVRGDVRLLRRHVRHRHRVLLQAAVHLASHLALVDPEARRRAKHGRELRHALQPRHEARHRPDALPDRRRHSRILHRPEPLASHAGQPGAGIAQAVDVLDLVDAGAVQCLPLLQFLCAQRGGVRLSRPTRGTQPCFLRQSAVDVGPDACPGVALVQGPHIGGTRFLGDARRGAVVGVDVELIA